MGPESPRARAGPADQHELVAAQAAQHVGSAQRRGQPAPHFLQEEIAVLMAVGVIDGLETVQIDHADQDAAALAQRAALQAFQLFVDGAAIGQAGERIAQRVRQQPHIGRAQLLDQQFAFHEVGEHGGEQLEHGLGLRRDGCWLALAPHSVPSSVSSARTGALT